MLKRVTVGLCVAMLLGAPPVSADSALQARISIPVSQTEIIDDVCTGESLLLSFSGFIDIHLVFNDNVAVGQVQFNLHGTATGLSSGVTYLLNSAVAQAQNFDINLDGTIVSTLIEELQLISLGGTPNLVAQQRNHITINANGTVTSFTSELTTACHG
jgi:hypothetical protein